MKIIIFTDLDGTLLDPETYSFEAARQALDLIGRMDIPLVLCSSKTRAELELYEKRLGNRHPFVSENGGGVFAPESYFSSGPFSGGMVRIGLSYSEIRKEFVELRNSLGISVKGFGDMTAEEVAGLTGLPREEAAFARERDFSEPFVFQKSADAPVFLDAVKTRGLNWTRGRLYCLMGEHDKGRAVRILKKAYEKEHGKIVTIGLGDALNDLPLLRETDVPVLVRKPDGTYEQEVKAEGLVLAAGVGPEGWNASVLDILNSGLVSGKIPPQKKQADGRA